MRLPSLLLLLCASPALAGPSVFIDFSETPKLPTVELDKATQLKIADRLTGHTVTLDESGCRDSGEDLSEVSVVKFRGSVRAPSDGAASNRLVHLVNIWNCLDGRERDAETYLVLTGSAAEGVESISKVKTSFADRISKVFQLEKGGPAGVIIEGTESGQGYTSTTASVYALEGKKFRLLRNLGRVGDADCGATGKRGERVALFQLKSVKPFVLTQKNVARTCEDLSEDRKRFTPVGEGPLKEE
jgi:hypothetical protein